MPLSKLTPSFTFTEDRLRELKAVVPEAFADGKVNWEALREALGNYLEDDEQGAEHFGLTWPGKRDARRLAAMPSKGTLIPAPSEGVDEDSTRNLFIEGDNLEVLKLLQKSYAGRAKMIYIDPPYNTGNDFVYKDDFKEPLEDYLRKTGQMAEAGEMLTSNPKAGGRFHSNWLNMMYPRLLLARQFLRPDGAVFVSIDDNEAPNLILLMNEIFGEESFVADIAVVNNLKGRNDRQHIATAHEHLLFYAQPEFVSFGLQLTEKQRADYGETDEEGEAFQWRDLRKRGGADTKESRPNLHYPIFANPETGEVAIETSKDKIIKVLPKKSDGSDGCWRWSREKVAKNLHDIRAFKVAAKDKWNVSYRVYLSKDGKMRSAKPKSVWLGSQYSTDSATKGLRELLPDGAELTPKAIGFIKAILQQSSEDEDICLDFFAGSATTAQAVLELNNEDGGSRRFIVVQLPETMENAKYPSIAELGKARIRRVIGNLRKEKKSRLELDGREFPLDLGFKVFKLARSNYRAWQDYTGDYVEELEDLFTRAETPLVDGWTPEGLLTETLLLEGFPLDSTVIEQAEFKHNKVWRVESDACAHRLWVCFDKKIKDKTLEALALPGEDIFICLDSALTDEAKVRLSDLGNVHVI